MNGLMPLETKHLYSLESEKAVVGSMMLSPKAIRLVAPILNADMFAGGAYRVMYECILKLSERKVAVDIRTMEAQLQSDNLLEDVGGLVGILGCAEIVVSPSNAVSYAEMVRDYWVLRQIESLGAKAQNLVRTGAPASEIFKVLRDELNVAQSATRRDGFRLRDIPLNQSRRALPSAFPSLNQNSEHGQALVRGQLTAYGAREGKGKSTTLLTEAAHLHRAGCNGLYYSLTDLNECDILSRMVRQRTGWSKKPDNPAMAESWEIAYSDVTDPYAAGSLTIMTGKAHGRSMQEIDAQIRAHQAESPLDFFVLDYWQRVKVPGRGTEKEKLDASSAWLSELAEDLDAVGLVGAQMTVTEDDTIFKGSRNLQEDSANCVYMKTEKGQPDKLRAEVSKMRYGNSFWDFILEFDKSRMLMIDKGEVSDW